MGYTLNQIEETFNKVISAYETNGFICKSFYDVGSHNGVEMTKGDITVRVSLDRGSESNKELTFPVSYFDLNITELNGDMLIRSINNHRFYFVTDYYYTTDLHEVCASRELNAKRYFDRKSHSCKSYHLNVSRISDRLIAYLKKAINKNICSLNDYSIKDIYFNYRNDSVCDLIVVIRHNDKSSTDTIYFKSHLI